MFGRGARYKALEGALIGRGDAAAVNVVFLAGGGVCVGSLLHAAAAPGYGGAG